MYLSFGILSYNCGLRNIDGRFRDTTRSRPAIGSKARPVISVIPRVVGCTALVGLRPYTRCRVALLFIILYFLLTSNVCRRRRYFRRLPPGSLAPTAAVIVVCAPLRRYRRRHRLVNRNGPSHPSPPPTDKTGPLSCRSRVCRRRNG